MGHSKRVLIEFLAFVALLPACMARSGFADLQAPAGCANGCGAGSNSTPPGTSGTGAATQLHFVSQPSPTAAVSAVLAQAPVVAAQDSLGHTVVTASVSIALTAYANAVCTIVAPGGLHAVANPVPASMGVAAFTGVSYSLASSPIFLGAFAAGLAPACSSRITMLPLTKPFGTPNGKIVVCGDFTTYTDTSTHTIGRGILRVNSDGTLDPAFNNGGTGGNYEISLCMQEVGTNGIPTEKIIIGGSFDHYNGAAVPGGLIRLNQDGTWDNTFNSGGAGISSGGLSGTILQELGTNGLPTGKILFTSGWGGFGDYDGVAANGIMRVNADGTADTTFMTAAFGPSSTVFGLAQELRTTTGLPTGRFVVGGTFSSYAGATVPSGVLRLNADGSLDPTFNSAGTGFAPSVGIQAVLAEFAATSLPTGKFLVTGWGGPWTYNDGTTHNTPSGLVRINGDGTWDSTYNFAGAGFNADARFLSWDIDDAGFLTGKTWVAGPTSQYNGTAIPIGVVRIDAAGGLDATLNPGQSGYDGGDVQWVVPTFGATGLPTGKMITFGSAPNTTFNGIAHAAPAYLSQLNANGTLDSSFNFHGTGAGIGGTSPVVFMGFQVNQ